MKEDSVTEKLSRFAVDISAASVAEVSHPGVAAVPLRDWLFVMDAPFTSRGAMRIFSDPPPAAGERSRLEREAREALGSWAGRISVAAAPPAFADAQSDPPFRVDEAI
jgi:hypothetical protein